jgi:hypothetical protein
MALVLKRMKNIYGLETALSTLQNNIDAADLRIRSSTIIPGSITLNNDLTVTGTTQITGDLEISSSSITVDGEILQPLDLSGNYSTTGTVTNVSARWNSTYNILYGGVHYDLLMANALGTFSPTKIIPPEAEITIDCGDY